jgi:hypothetical protein
VSGVRQFAIHEIECGIPDAPLGRPETDF